MIEKRLTSVKIWDVKSLAKTVIDTIGAFLLLGTSAKHANYL